MGLTVGLLLLPYSVVCTVESLSFVFTSFSYLDLYVLEDDAYGGTQRVTAPHLSHAVFLHTYIAGDSG